MKKETQNIWILVILVALYQNTIAQTNGTGSGNCLGFDGTNDYVITAANNALDAHHIGTVEMWVKINAIGAAQTFLTYSTDASNNSLYIIEMTGTGKLEILYKYGGALTPHFIGTTSLNANEWYHLAFVADGSNQIKPYINGELETWNSFDAQGTSANGSEWFADITSVGSFNHYIDIGAFRRASTTPGSVFFDGDMDELRIWNVAKSQTQLKDKMTTELEGNESGLVGYWRFDESAPATVAEDSSPNGNDGTLN